jgi:RHS repeat-associated protein
LAATPAEHHLFEYDKASNRTRSALYLNGVVSYDRAYSYNGANQLTNAGFTYDANGNMTHDGTGAYTWDRANRLLSHGGSSHAYNGMGQRLSQTVGSIVTQYLQDTQPGLFRVIKSDNGTVVNRFVHDQTGIHSHEASTGVWNWMLKDGLGSVRDIRDTAGNSAYSVQYAPYGEQFSPSGTNPTDYGYTGEWEDQNDLVYLRARYYDPGLGVFVSQDPLELANRYGYVGGNPIRRTDPLGLATSQDLISAYYTSPCQADILRPHTSGEPCQNQIWYTGNPIYDKWMVDLGFCVPVKPQPSYGCISK